MEVNSIVWCTTPHYQRKGGGDSSANDEAWVLKRIASRDYDSIQLCAVHVDNFTGTISRPARNFDSRETRMDCKVGEDKQYTMAQYEGVECANFMDGYHVLRQQDQEHEINIGSEIPLDDYDNLITLTHLNEPTILNALHRRFVKGKIYTFTGPVLLAVNPFQNLPLYGEDMIELFKHFGEATTASPYQKAQNSTAIPHVYSIADAAYRQMMQSMQSAQTGTSDKNRSQSIIISGESGAGKTETTKFVMYYLTSLGSSDDKIYSSVSSSNGDSKSNEQGTSIMERVLQSSPILEAFGNARTLRNENSSRFGKLVELGFSQDGKLVGAKVKTYLLEKIRMCCHTDGERTFHIFYQLLRGAPEYIRKKLSIDSFVRDESDMAAEMHYTSHGGNTKLRDGTDDEGFARTSKAMQSMGWTGESIEKVLMLAAGVLCLGQVHFDVNDAMERVQVAEESTLSSAAYLLGVDLDKLRDALTIRVMTMRGETITMNLSKENAVRARDALAKTVYGALFLWIVSQVNECIGCKKDDAVYSTIGVLDIFGFECFAVNSFEQLCINLANEALQQQFNRFVFKVEQAVYKDQGIDCSFIDFVDNQDCLDAMQARPNGVLPLLDDECWIPKGSDQSWANRMYKTLENAGEPERMQRFLATTMQQSKSQFCIRHFAGIVTYSAMTGFLEKNKDEIPLAAQRMFESAPSELVQGIFSVQMREVCGNASTDGSQGASPLLPTRSRPVKSKTVGQQFKLQLHNLVKRIESTDLHYIRCLKPNDIVTPNVFARNRVVEQLRCNGVLEAVRVARDGYPVRLDHGDFFHRYSMLAGPSSSLATEIKLLGNDNGDPLRTSCCKLAEIFLLCDDLGCFDIQKGKGASNNNLSQRRLIMQKGVQVGKTKVFMKRKAHSALEEARATVQHRSSTIVQTFVRRIQQQKCYNRVMAATLQIHRFCRGVARNIRCRRQAGEYVSCWSRTRLQRRRFLHFKTSTIGLQALVRGICLRRRHQRAAAMLQILCRAVLAKRRLRAFRETVVALQNMFRCRQAVLRLTMKQLECLSTTSEQKSVKPSTSLLSDISRTDVEAETRPCSVSAFTTLQNAYRKRRFCRHHAALKLQAHARMQESIPTVNIASGKVVGGGRCEVDATKSCGADVGMNGAFIGRGRMKGAYVASQDDVGSLDWSASLVQSWVLMVLQRRKFMKVKQAATLIQKAARGLLNCNRPCFGSDTSHCTEARQFNESTSALQQCFVADDANAHQQVLVKSEINFEDECRSSATKEENMSTSSATGGVAFVRKDDQFQIGGKYEARCASRNSAYEPPVPDISCGLIDSVEQYSSIFECCSDITIPEGLRPNTVERRCQRPFDNQLVEVRRGVLAGGNKELKGTQSEQLAFAVSLRQKLRLMLVMLFLNIATFSGSALLLHRRSAVRIELEQVVWMARATGMALSDLDTYLPNSQSWIW